MGVSATGFIYVVRSVGPGYQQPSLQQVPTWFDNRIYFGPCKIPMRPRMKEGDYIFGISPSGVGPRRLIFAARIARKLTYGKAYQEFPRLRGPLGPIHVRPTTSPGLGFPHSHYEHIPGANHPGGDWVNDLRTPELDAFFECEPAGPILGRWLGSGGPILSPKILAFLRTCAVYGKTGHLGLNSSATVTAPVRYGHLYTGLHLETSVPRQLLQLISEEIGTRASGSHDYIRQRASQRLSGRRRSLSGHCGSAKKVSQVLFVRVGADQTEGGGAWNGPIDLRTREFVYVPIPESRAQRAGLTTPYSDLMPALTKFGVLLPSHLTGRAMHLDPDFEFLTYGDQGAKGRQISSAIGGGDMLVFYTALRAVNGHQLVYAVIGALTVKDVTHAIDIPETAWHRNAHTRRALDGDADDVVTIGDDRSSGRLTRAIPIGTYRDGAYRVEESLLRQWGGLTARDGYLQRSAVLPGCVNSSRFLQWWRQQDVELVKENNPP
jgi:hypothetical protein